MTSNQFRRLRALGASVASATIVLAAPAALTAQTADQRFQPWIGCWVAGDTPTTNILSSAPNGLVCVVPAAKGSGVEVASISNGKVFRRESIDATGVRVAKTLDNCPGWEIGTWSADNNRLFLRSEFTCANNTVIAGSSILSMSSEGQWVQIEGTTVGKTSSANMLRFHAAGIEIALNPGEVLADSMTVRTRPASNGIATRSIRMVAGEEVSAEDVLDATRNVDRAVAEAWVTELGQQFDVNAQTLVAMADKGMPGTMIDLLVALSYPTKFAVRANDVDAVRVPRGNRAYIPAYGYGYGLYGGYASCGINSFGYGDFYDMSLMGYGYGACSPRRFNNFGYFYGGSPVIISPRPPSSGVPIQQRGQAVNGRGYTRSRGDEGSSSTQTSRASGSSSSSGGASSGAASSGSGSGSGSGSTGRTAKARN